MKKFYKYHTIIYMISIKYCIFTLVSVHLHWKNVFAKYKIQCKSVVNDCHGLEKYEYMLAYVHWGAINRVYI